MSVCLYCGQQIPLLSRLRGETRFCSKGHHALYRKETEHLALEAIRMAGAAAVPAPAPLTPLESKEPNPAPHADMGHAAPLAPALAEIPPAASFQSAPSPVAAADSGSLPRRGDDAAPVAFAGPVALGPGLPAASNSLGFYAGSLEQSWRPDALAGACAPRNGVHTVERSLHPLVALTLPHGPEVAPMAEAGLVLERLHLAVSAPAHRARLAEANWNRTRVRPEPPVFSATLLESAALEDTPPEEESLCEDVAPPPVSQVLMALPAPAAVAPGPVSVSTPWVDLKAAPRPRAPICEWAPVAARDLLSAGIEAEPARLLPVPPQATAVRGRAGEIVRATARREFPIPQSDVACKAPAAGLELLDPPAAQKSSAIPARGSMGFLLPKQSLSLETVVPAAAPPVLPMLDELAALHGPAVFPVAAVQKPAPKQVRRIEFAGRPIPVGRVRYSEAALSLMDGGVAVLQGPAPRRLDAAPTCGAVSAEAFSTATLHGTVSKSESRLALPVGEIVDAPAIPLLRDSVSSCRQPAGHDYQRAVIGPPAGLPRLTAAPASMPPVSAGFRGALPDLGTRPAPLAEWCLPIHLEDLTEESTPQTVAEIAPPLAAPRAVAVTTASLIPRLNQRERPQWDVRPRTEGLPPVGLFIPQLRLGPLRPRITYGAQDLESPAATPKGLRRGSVIPISERRSGAKQEGDAPLRAQGGKGA